MPTPNPTNPTPGIVCDPALLTKEADELEAAVRASHRKGPGPRGYCDWRATNLRGFNSQPYKVGCSPGTVASAEFMSFGKHCPCCCRPVRLFGFDPATWPPILETKKALEQGRPVCEGPEPTGEETSPEEGGRFQPVDQSLEVARARFSVPRALNYPSSRQG